MIYCIHISAPSAVIQTVISTTNVTNDVVTDDQTQQGAAEEENKQGMY